MPQLVFLGEIVIKHSLFCQKCWSFTLSRHEEYKRKIDQILLVGENDPNFRIPKASNDTTSGNLEDYDQTNVYAWKSDWNLHLCFPILQELCEDIKTCLNEIIKEEKIRNTSEIETINCWINKYKKNNFAVPHKHQQGGWSAVYMMKIPKDSNSIFRVHNPLGLTYNSELMENFATLDINAKEGSVLIMPGALEHEVTSNMSEETRITAAMNFRMFDKFSPKVDV